MLKTIVRNSFQAIVKLHSGTTEYEITVEGDSITENWCEAFETATFYCESNEGVLLGMFVKSADASREEVRDNPDSRN